MRTVVAITSLRVVTWCCVLVLGVLSLLPAQELVRTGLPGRVEHIIAYAGSAAIAMAGYGASWGVAQIIGGFWVYAGILEYLQHFSPGRHPAIGDFAASALGALCSGLVIAFLGGGCRFSRIGDHERRGAQRGLPRGGDARAR